MGSDFIVIVPLLPSLCIFLSLNMGYLFFVDSITLLSMVVQQLVVILVLWQEEISPYPSTLPSWTGSSSALNVWNVLNSDLKLITSFQRQVHKVILIESPVTYPPPSKRKKKNLSFYSIEDMNYVRETLAFSFSIPHQWRRLFTLKRGLHFCSRFCLTEYTQFPSPPLPHPSWLSLLWTPPEMALPVCILLFLGKCLLTLKSQFTCLWPVCLSLPPICSCFLWVSKGLYANSYSHASHSWVIIFYSFIPQTFVKLPECFRHYPRSLGIQQRTS